jgi:hypothetical protein
MTAGDSFPAQDLAQAAARMSELVEAGIDPADGDASLNVLQRALERGNELFRDLQKSRTPSGAIDQIAGADADQLRLIALDRIFTAGPEGEDGGVESTEAYEDFVRAVDVIAAAAAAKEALPEAALAIFRRGLKHGAEKFGSLLRETAEDGPPGVVAGIDEMTLAELRLVVFATAWAAAEAGGDQMAIRQEWET